MIAKRSFLQALGAAALLSSPLARVAAATDASAEPSPGAPGAALRPKP